MLDHDHRPVDRNDLHPAASERRRTGLCHRHRQARQHRSERPARHPNPEALHGWVVLGRREQPGLAPHRTAHLSAPAGSGESVHQATMGRRVRDHQIDTKAEMSMSWKAHLEGHDFELESLADLFADGDPRVSREQDGSFVLETAGFDQCPDAVAVKEVAEHLLATMNGAAKAADPSFTPVAVASHFRNAEGLHAVVLAGTAVARSRVYPAAITGGEQTAPEPPRARDWHALSATDANVRDALRILGTGDLDWIGLYKVYEIIRHDVGGQAAITSAGWADASEISAFGASANRPDVSGDEARHARLPGSPPKLTLSLHDARQLVRRIVEAWLVSKTRPEL